MRAGTPSVLPVHAWGIPEGLSSQLGNGGQKMFPPLLGDAGKMEQDVGSGQTCSGSDAEPSLRSSFRVSVGNASTSHQRGVGLKELSSCKEPTLVPSSGVRDPGPGTFHKSGISYPFEKHLLGTYFVQGLS